MAVSVPADFVLRDLPHLLSADLRHRRRIQYPAVVVQSQSRHDFPRSCGAGRRTSDRWSSGFEVLGFSRGDDRSAVEARLAARIFTGSVFLRGRRVRRAQLAPAGKSRRRVDRALLFSVRRTLLHPEPAFRRAGRGGRTVWRFTPAARASAPDARGSDAGRERVVASVDGTVRDREHGSLAVGKSTVRPRRKSEPIDCGSARADRDAGRL